MYIIIIGCGKVGYQLTQALLSADHEVTTIENSSVRYQSVLEVLGSAIIHGDGTEPAVLEAAGTQRADVLIAATGNDESNLVSSQVAKHRFNVPRTIGLTKNPQNDDLFHDLGIDVVVSRTEIILAYVEEEVSERTLVHMLPLPGSRRELVGVHIPQDAAVVGKPLDEVLLPNDTLISLLVGSDGEPRLPSNGAVFQADDEVIALTTPNAEQMLMSVLTRVE